MHHFLKKDCAPFRDNALQRSALLARTLEACACAHEAHVSVVHEAITVPVIMLLKPKSQLPHYRRSSVCS